VGTPKVSVLSPTYQHVAFIGDCIRSVLAQTMPDWEMMSSTMDQMTARQNLPNRLTTLESLSFDFNMKG